jgi:UDP-N-acetylmuramoyl-tripeptide--D-alanyl-D-alanine ligase
VLVALQQLATHHRRQLRIPFIAITGSNGKTTTKELVSAVLRTRYRTYTTAGNLNNHIGVPLTILGIRNDAEIAVIEMGANHLHEIEAYCRIALPTHGIITNCGKAHIEGFGSEAGVRQGKGELYDFIREHEGTIFRNTDLPYLEEMAHGIRQQVTYGMQQAQYTGRPLMDGVFLQVELESPLSMHIPTRLVGDYNFANVMTAAATGLHLGVPADQVRAAIEAYEPDNSRSQWLHKGSNAVILDAYNANPTSMAAAIRNFAAAPLERKMLWIGAMKEMGETSRREHEALVTLITQYEWSEVILVGKEFSDVAKDYRHFEDANAAATYIREHRPEQASILIKGSRGSRMELLLDAL